MKPEEYFKLQQIKFQNANIKSWISRKKHFLNSPLERISRHDLFLNKNKNNHSQKQQMIKPRALVCTSAYATLIKRNNESFFILKFGKLTQYFCMKSNFWNIKTFSILVKVCIYILYIRQRQGYCLIGAWSPEAPKIYLWLTKIWNKKPEQVHENHDSQYNFR